MHLRSVLLLSVLVLMPLPLAAQLLPFSIALDARVGMVVPTGEFASSEHGFASESGIGYAVGGALYPVRSIGVFAGYQRSDFSCAQCATLGLDDSAVVEGLEAGLHVAVPVSGLPVAPWVRGGVIRQNLAFSGFGDSMSSEPQIGFTGGAGVTVPLMQWIELNPAIRYFAVPAEFTFTTLPERSVDVTAFSVDLGVSFRF